MGDDSHSDTVEVKGDCRPSGTRVTRAASRNAPPKRQIPRHFFLCFHVVNSQDAARPSARARAPPTHRSLTSRTATPPDPQSGAGEPGARAPPALQPAAAGKPRRHEPLAEATAYSRRQASKITPGDWAHVLPEAETGCLFASRARTQGLVAPLRRPRPQPLPGEHRALQQATNAQLKNVVPGD